MTGVEANRGTWLRSPPTADVALAAALGVVGVFAEIRGSAWLPPPALGGYLIAIATGGMVALRAPGPAGRRHRNRCALLAVPPARLPRADAP